MATKINPDFYGAENSFVTITADIAKKSAYTIADLFNNGKYTGGSYDATASPWGIGKSSISSDYQAQATKGATWTIYSHVNERKNTPIWFYNCPLGITGGDRPEEITGSEATDYRFARMLYKNRTSPNVTISGSDLKSTNTIDNNDTISVPNTNTITPVTFLDYSKTRVCLGNVYYKINGNPYFGSTSFANFAAGGVTTDAIYGFDFTIRDVYGNALSVYASIGGSELTIPDVYKTCYYGDDVTSWVRPWRRIASVGYWSIPNLAWREFNTSMGCINTSDMETINANDNAIGRTGSNGWGHTSDTMQTFDDVSYHWDMGFTRWASNWWSIDKVNTGDTFVSGTYRSYAYMIIDEGTADYESLTKAILHEIAFLGLPFCFSTAKATSAIGSDDIYLPVFDEHMITTGDYKNGSASLDLPNATWGDVFSADMPDYDPEYDPDAPPDPDDDEGDLDNLGHNRYIGKGLKVYVIPTANYTQSFLPALNALYQDKTPDDWAIDFQGENPSNYIVAAFNTFFAVPTQGITTNITLGVVDTGITADVYDRGKPQSETFTFGTRHIDPVYNDFRDYAPYTNIELYLPLCGTIPLETAYIMNHDITINYWYDITTMSCTACVYRDNMLYKTLDGSLGVPAPLLASDMGSYQNQIKQIENAKTQNNMRMATSAISLTAGIATAVASGGTAVVPEVMGIAGGIMGLSKSLETAKEIDYKIDHTMPTISTTGASESQNNMCVGQLMPKLIIKRPLMLPNKNDTIYSKTVGNACCINDYIGNMTGLIVCSNINANDIVNTYGGSPTADEINAIKQAFSKGVIV